MLVQNIGESFLDLAATGSENLKNERVSYKELTKKSQNVNNGIFRLKFEIPSILYILSANWNTQGWCLVLPLCDQMREILVGLMVLQNSCVNSFSAPLW